MSLRARLVLAFVLLAVVPLTAVTLYSYVASERAFRAAVEAEAGALAEDMRHRMVTVRSDLGQKLEAVGQAALMADANPEHEDEADETMDALEAETLKRRIEQAVGDVAGLVESLELIPEPPSPPGVPEPPDVDPDPDLAGVPDGAALAAQIREQVERARKQALAAAEEVRRQQGESRARRDEVRREKGVVMMRRGFGIPLRRHGRHVATVRPLLETDHLMRELLGPLGLRPGEVPFAVDAAGRVHTAGGDAERLPDVSQVVAAGGPEGARQALPDWVVVTRREPDSGLTFGVARPIREPLKQIQRTALRNLALGLGAVGLGLVAIVPLSRRITRELGVLTEGAERLARGDLEARVPVRSRDEVGRLADAFNRMAHELRENQDRLLAQERLQKELEMGRRIQEEMLPRDKLRVAFAEVKGVSIPAREVGGDLFNYFTLPGGEAALLVGDVSGKGVAAALLMANLQATLRARLPLERDLAALADELDHEIDATTGGNAYLTLFLGVLDPSGAMRYVNAGHNTPFALHADGRIEPLESTGRPLGLLAGGGFVERTARFEPGSCLFLYTDGVIESENADGEPFGLDRLQELLVTERTSGLDGILSRVEDAVRAYRDGAEPADDATLVVLKVGGNAS
jgi:serine phosphatase RsbU (regulator of sigma subunit)